MFNQINRPTRSGKVLVLLAILLPTLLGIVGLVVDGGLMMGEFRVLQHAADAASTAAAMTLSLGKGHSAAIAAANEVVNVGNSLPDALVTIHIPPITGLNIGEPNHVEVIVKRTYRPRLISILSSVTDHSMQVRSVAGVDEVTAGAAIVVLDPQPADISLGGVTQLLSTINANSLTAVAVSQTGASAYLTPIPIVGPTAASLVNASLTSLLPSLVTNLLGQVTSSVNLTPLPTLTAGLEVEGLGRLIVDGAIHVNTEWGGVDENGEKAGIAAGPPYAMACMPILSTTRVRARDIRVVGGVDDKDSYRPFDPSDRKPLQANRLPVADPYEGLPVPSTASDGTNVTAAVRSPAHSVRVALSSSQANTLANGVLGALSALLKPLFTPLIANLTTLLTQPTLEPGVYDSITVLAPLGGAKFNPGVYVIRNKSPLTNMSLCILGPVDAQGVLFYVTDSSSYSAASGQPDAADDSTVAPANPVTSLIPSVVIATLMSGGRITGLDDPASPFHGLLIYQRPLDRRLIVLEVQQLLGGGDVSGSIYAKWAHTVFVGGAGTYDLRFVTGTMRVITAFDTTLAPGKLFPPAQDVLLLE